MKTLTIAVLALALCGCSEHPSQEPVKYMYASDIQAREKAAYLAGYLDGKDGRPPTPDAPNSQIGKPDGPSPKAGDGK